MNMEHRICMLNDQFTRKFYRLKLKIVLRWKYMYTLYGKYESDFSDGPVLK